MSEQTPYEKLGVTEDASFDEIKQARDRLIAQQEGDGKHREAIEAAYDAVLMERLRLRQEGRIKVPDRIRFPEKLTPAPPSVPPTPAKQSPAWLQGFFDTPDRRDIWLPGGIFLALGGAAWFNPPLALALAVLVSIYFLNRKEHKLGRSLLLTLVGSAAGIFLGVQLAKLLLAQISGVQLTPESVAAWVTLVFLWLITSFLR
jgi:hypothetical protein